MANSNAEAATAVLKAANTLFDEMEKRDEFPALERTSLRDGIRRIATECGLTVPRVRVLLQTLHRQGKIHVHSAMGQELLAVSRYELTLPPVVNTGHTLKLGRQHPRSRPEAEAEAVDDPDGLAAEVERLGRLVERLQDDLARSEQRRLTAQAQRRDARAETRQVRQQLSAAQVTVRRLQALADRVPGLEEEIAALQHAALVPDDLADRIARLTTG